MFISGTRWIICVTLAVIYSPIIEIGSWDLHAHEQDGDFRYLIPMNEDPNNIEFQDGTSELYDYVFRHDFRIPRFQESESVAYDTTPVAIWSDSMEYHAHENDYAHEPYYYEAEPDTILHMNDQNIHPPLQMQYAHDYKFAPNSNHRDQNIKSGKTSNSKLGRKDDDLEFNELDVEFNDELDEDEDLGDEHYISHGDAFGTSDRFYGLKSWKVRKGSIFDRTKKKFAYRRRDHDYTNRNYVYHRYAHHPIDKHGYIYDKEKYQNFHHPLDKYPEHYFVKGDDKTKVEVEHAHKLSGAYYALKDKLTKLNQDPKYHNKVTDAYDHVTHTLKDAYHHKTEHLHHLHHFKHHHHHHDHKYHHNPHNYGW